MTRKLGALLAVAAGLPLSGCQSFPLFNYAHAHSAQALAAAEAGTGHYTGLGRQELDNGQTGAAIDTFRVALAMGEDPAAALNGLGVAYTRLGRSDAAADLFTKAAQLDPLNPRYARNLARIEESRQALAHAGSATAVADAQSVAAAEPQPRAGEATRISPSQVAIRSVSTKPISAPLPVIAGPPADGVLAPGAKAEVNSRFKPLLRVALREPAAARQPIRPAGRQALASLPRSRVGTDFVPAVRVQFADAQAGGGKSKVIVIAER